MLWAPKRILLPVWEGQIRACLAISLPREKALQIHAV